MEEMTLRILLALSRNLGRAMSIQDLTREIRRLYGRAYYANTYNAVQALRKQGLLRFGQLGRASSISLNLDSYRLLDLLTELELRKKGAILEHIPRAEGTFAELDRCLRDIGARFALITEAERNFRLNRVELLICTAAGQEAQAAEAIESLGRRLAIRIDALPVSQARLLEYLSKTEQNPIQETLATATALFNPQEFWAAIGRADSEGRHCRIAEPLAPAALSAGDLLFNLGRFGFPLLGGPPNGRQLSIELTAMAALLSGEPRFREGAAVILAKNRFDARLLAFLATKHGRRDELRGLIGAGAPSENKRELRRLLTTARARPARSSLAKTMETYHAA